MTYANGEKTVRKWQYAKGYRSSSFASHEETASLEITNRRVIAQTSGKSSMVRTEMDIDSIKSVRLEYGSNLRLGIILIVIGAVINLLLSALVLIYYFLPPVREFISTYIRIPYLPVIIKAIGYAGWVIFALFLALGLSKFGKKVEIVFNLTAQPNSFICVRKGSVINRSYQSIKVDKAQAQDIVETLGAYLLEVRS